MPATADASGFEGRTWLVLGTGAGIDTALAERLQILGARTVLVPRPADTTALAAAASSALEEALANDAHPLAGVVHLWGMNDALPNGFEQLQASQAHGVLSALHVAQQLVERRVAARLWLATRGVQHAVEDDAVDATQAPRWGVGTSIAMGSPFMGNNDHLRAAINNLPSGIYYVRVQASAAGVVNNYETLDIVTSGP